MSRRSLKAAVRSAALPMVTDDRDPLVRVLDDAAGQDAPVSIVYAHREYIQPEVRAFVHLAVPILQGALVT